MAGSGSQRFILSVISRMLASSSGGREHGRVSWCSVVRWGRPGPCGWGDLPASRGQGAAERRARLALPSPWKRRVDGRTAPSKFQGSVSLWQWLPPSCGSRRSRSFFLPHVKSRKLKDMPYMWTTDDTSTKSPRNSESPGKYPFQHNQLKTFWAEVTISLNGPGYFRHFFSANGSKRRATSPTRWLIQSA